MFTQVWLETQNPKDLSVIDSHFPCINTCSTSTLVSFITIWQESECFNQYNVYPACKNYCSHGNKITERTGISCSAHFRSHLKWRQQLTTPKSIFVWQETRLTEQLLTVNKNWIYALVQIYSSCAFRRFSRQEYSPIYFLFCLVDLYLNFISVQTSCFNLMWAVLTKW